MPGRKAQLGPRTGVGDLSWAADAIDLDSLARMQLATAGAVWCNAYDAGFEDLFLAKRTASDWADVMCRARQAGAAHFTFATSGSTGQRKHIRHREDLLAAEAQAWADVLHQVQPAIQRVVVLCPTHHIYGFIWGVLLPRLLGLPVVDADLSALPQLLAGDLVVAVPDQWAWLSSAAHKWTAGVQGVSSTAPMPAHVHEQLTHATAGLNPPLGRLLQIYGSTETAGLAFRTQSTGPYTLAPKRLRNAQDGIDLLLPHGERQAMAVQDGLAWQSETTFELLRRNDDSVQVGGHNVSPAWVVAQLLTQPCVKQASVRLDSHQAQGKLKAFVVLAPAASAAERERFEQWVLDTLPWYAGFSSITYGAELPRNAIGKAADWPVAAHAIRE
jgi:long-chain acyl-CoA synthetase